MGDILTSIINALQLVVGNSGADELTAALTRYTAATADPKILAQFKLQSSGDMATGHGPALSFIIRDTAGVDNEIARIVVDRYGADNTGRIRIYLAATGVLTERLQIASSIGSFFSSLSIAYGNFTSGTPATNRGTITAYHGPSGNTPGYLVTYSPNGTPWYWFTADDGTCRVSSSAPSSNSSGTVIGLQY